MNHSFTEENYLKTIFKLAEQTSGNVSTNAIAEVLQTKASSVTDMIKKLGEKHLLDHKPYQGVALTDKGRMKALSIIRKHRLWEVFLVDHLGIGWDEVHDIAEQLEHTHSEQLYSRLDKFLNFPRFDPHGDPIPDQQGVMVQQPETNIGHIALGEQVIVQGIVNHDAEFLQYLESIGLVPGARISVIARLEFDGSQTISINQQAPCMISSHVASNVLVKR